MDPVERLQPLLKPGESLLWSGKPASRTSFGFGNLITTVAVYVWTGGMITWVATAVAAHAGLGFVWPGLVLAALGIFVIANNAFFSYYNPKRTALGVTGQRVLIASGQEAAEIPLCGQPVSVRRTRDGRPGAVIVGDKKLMDVADPDGMLQAMEQARSLPPAATQETYRTL